MDNWISLYLATVRIRTSATRNIVHRSDWSHVIFDIYAALVPCVYRVHYTDAEIRMSLLLHELPCSCNPNQSLANWFLPGNFSWRRKFISVREEEKVRKNIFAIVRKNILHHNQKICINCIVVYLMNWIVVY